MQLHRSYSVCLVFTLLCSTAFAKRTTLEIGKPAPGWSALQGVDDKAHSLDELKAAKAVVVVFTSDDCPVAKAYQSRLAEMNASFQDQGVVFVAINPNKNASIKQMSAHAKSSKIEFAYLHDAKQSVAKSFGATRTPEVFLLNENRQLAYTGAIDDDVRLQGKPKKRYLRDAIEAVLAGKQPAKTKTKSIGCAIRWK